RSGRGDGAPLRATRLLTHDPAIRRRPDCSASVSGAPPVVSDKTAGPPADLPRFVGGYLMLDTLGRERLAPMARARHMAAGREVAVTVLKNEWSCLPPYVARLVRDAYAVTPVRHPNLVGLIDVGEAQGRCYFVTELVEGASLEERVETQGPLAPRE